MTEIDDQLDKKIDSLQQLQRQMPQILKEINAQEDLALAAAANPLLALEQLGYDITPEVQREIELRARFGSDRAQEYEGLESTIFKIAGKRFDLGSSQQIHDILQELLSEQSKGNSERSRGTQRVKRVLETVKTPVLFSFSAPNPQDPLSEFADLHEILPLLIQYRRLERGHPRLATPQAFQQLRQRKLDTPITRIHFKLQERSQRREVTSAKSSNS